jgi:UV DNA damage repair endonuclease
MTCAGEDSAHVSNGTNETLKQRIDRINADQVVKNSENAASVDFVVVIQAKKFYIYFVSTIE